MTMVSCFSCSSLIQSYKYLKTGYLTLKRLEQQYCLRCYHSITYLELSKNAMIDDLVNLENNFFNYLQRKSGVIFYVISITDFYGSLLNFHKNLSEFKVYLVITKINHLNGFQTVSNIMRWVQSKVKKLPFKVTKIIWIYNFQENDIQNIHDILQEQTTNIYWIGKNNVNKTLLINKVLLTQKELPRELPKLIENSNNLYLIALNYENKIKLYDITNNFDQKQLNYYTNKTATKLLNQEFKLERKAIKLKCNETLTIVGLLQLTVKSSTTTTFNCYSANKLILHTHQSNNKARIWQQQLVFFKEDVIMIEHHITINKEQEELVGIHINGYGWITFKARKQELILLLPQDCSYQIIKPII